MQKNHIYTNTHALVSQGSLEFENLFYSITVCVVSQTNTGMHSYTCKCMTQIRMCTQTNSFPHTSTKSYTHIMPHPTSV